LLAKNTEHVSNDEYDFASFEAIPFQAVIISSTTKASPFGANRSLGIFFFNHFSSPLSGLVILRYQCFSNVLAILGRGTDQGTNVINL